jgi:hypothetical protein
MHYTGAVEWVYSLLKILICKVRKGEIIQTLKLSKYDIRMINIIETSISHIRLTYRAHRSGSGSKIKKMSKMSSHF